MYCVYKYVYQNKIIYIGKTDSSLEARIYGHSKEDKFKPYLTDCEIYYIALRNSVETSVIEKILINKYRPILNIADKTDSELPVIYNDAGWLLYKPTTDMDKETDISKYRKNNKLTPYREEIYKERTALYELNHINKPILEFIISDLDKDIMQPLTYNIFLSEEKLRKDILIVGLIKTGRFDIESLRCDMKISYHNGTLFMEPIVPYDTIIEHCNDMLHIISEYNEIYMEYIHVYNNYER